MIRICPVPEKLGQLADGLCQWCQRKIRVQTFERVRGLKSSIQIACLQLDLKLRQTLCLCRLPDEHEIETLIVHTAGKPVIHISAKFT